MPGKTWRYVREYMCVRSQYNIITSGDN